MATKNLNVRISNRYDTYEAWTAANPILLKGEIAAVTVNTTQTDTKGNIINVPCILLKIGNNTDSFNQLPWVSGLGVDTPEWARKANPPTVNASDVVGLEDFISGAVEDKNTQYQIVPDETDSNKLYLQSSDNATAETPTWTTVSTFTLTKVEAGSVAGTIKVNGTDMAITGWSDLSAKVTANETTITTLNGSDTTEGSVAKAVKDASDTLTTTMDTKIAAAIASTYKPAGSIAVAGLTSDLLVAANEGKVYNLSDAGTTTADFIEGAGNPLKAGDNVVIINTGTNEAPVFKFDVLSGIVDLSAYSTTTQMNTAIENAIDGLTADDIPSIPADKVTGLDEAISDAITAPGEGEEANPIYTNVTNVATTVATEKINALDFTDTPADGEFVTSVTQKDGLINVNRSGITLDQIGDVASGSTVVLNCGGATI